MIKVLFVRYGQKQAQDDDMSAPLSAGGVEQARRLAARLGSLGLRPDVFLASRVNHAFQTAEILRETLRPDPKYSVVAATALTPGTAEPDFDWASMLQEAARSVDVRGAGIIACVGHEPRLGQLIARLTRTQIGVLGNAQAVCVEAGNLDQLGRAEGQIGLWISDDPLPPQTEPETGPQDDKERSLQPKLQSKMQVSTLLAGFTFAALVNLLTEPSFWQTPDARAVLPAAALILLAWAVALFVAAVYMFDRLSMPRQFWAGERRILGGPGSSFGRDFATHGLVYAYMIWIWKYVFTVAVFLAILGFLFVVAYRANAYIAVPLLAGIAAVGVFYWRTRPELGVVD